MSSEGETRTFKNKGKQLHLKLQLVEYISFPLPLVAFIDYFQIFTHPRWCRISSINSRISDSQECKNTEVCNTRPKKISDSEEGMLK